MVWGAFQCRCICSIYMIWFDLQSVETFHESHDRYLHPLYKLDVYLNSLWTWRKRKSMPFCHKSKSKHIYHKCTNGTEPCKKIVDSYWGSSEPKMVSTMKANRWQRVVTCSMPRRFALKKQLFDEPDEKNDDAISGRDHEGENKTEEWRIYPAESQFRRGKFHKREL